MGPRRAGAASGYMQACLRLAHSLLPAAAACSQCHQPPIPTGHVRVLHSRPEAWPYVLMLRLKVAGRLKAKKLPHTVACTGVTATMEQPPNDSAAAVSPRS